MKKMNLIGVLAAPVLMFAIASPSFADSTCKDGTTSTATGKGTCSGHGGVQKAAASAGTTGAMSGAATSAAPAKTTPPAATSAAPAAAAGPAPAGATAKCKDGTYSTSKSHSGACSKHGGVSDFLTPAK